MLTYEEMIAEVDQLMHNACEKEGVEYDHFVSALNDAFDARFEIVEM